MDHKYAESRRYISHEDFIKIMEANIKTHNMHLVNATDINRIIARLTRRIKRLEDQLDMHLEGHE